STLGAGDIDGADALAGALDYEVVQFTDTATGFVYYGLREQLVNGQPTRGWGSFFLNFDFVTDKLVEVPHPLYDQASEDIGALVYHKAGAHGFIMAGAHRNANGTGTADVTHLPDSIFETVHEAWNGPAGETMAWQMHGFAITNHPTFPQGTAAVLSNGA